jgi:Flp pilus assembly protein TadD
MMQTIHRNLLCSMTAFIALAGVLLAGGCNKPETRMSYAADQDADDSWYDATDRPPSPNTLYSMARILADQGRGEEAIYVLERIIRDYPNFMPSYIELAEAQMRLRRTDAAISTLAAGLVHAPRDSVILNDLGMVYLIKGDPVQAMEWFRQAASNTPDNVRYRSNMALSLGLMGRYDESLAAYQQVVPAGDAHYNVAVICDARQDSQRASREYAIAEFLKDAPPGSERQAILGSDSYKPEPAPIDQAMDAGPDEAAE